MHLLAIRFQPNRARSQIIAHSLDGEREGEDEREDRGVEIKTNAFEISYNVVAKGSWKEMHE